MVNFLPNIDETRTGWPWEEQDVPSPSGSDSEATLPRITVITPSFNQAAFLEETIRSVLLQGYPNLEYIVIDGGSTDGSVEILRKYAEHLTYWISEPDGGQCQAINKGLARSTGDWMTWLNSDDVYLPGALWTVARTIAAHPESQWVIGPVVFTDVHLKNLGLFPPRCQTTDWLDFVCTKRRHGTSIPQSGSFWSRKAWVMAGPLDESLHYAMDHEYWGRLAFHGFRPHCLDTPLALFRQHGEAKTAQGEAFFLAEEMRVVERWMERTLPLSEFRQLRHYRQTFALRMLWQRIMRVVLKFHPGTMSDALRAWTSR